MKLQKQGWTFMTVVALVVGFASTAQAIEVYQERFEWGDLSKPTTLQGRVIILDPYGFSDSGTFVLLECSL